MESKIKRKLKKGDTVIVITGGNKKTRPNKGKTGKILKFVREDRVIVEGVNLVTKHTKSTRPGVQGGKIQKEGSIHISNVMYYSEDLKKPVRVKVQSLPDGKKVRGFVNPKTKKFTQIDVQVK